MKNLLLILFMWSPIIFILLSLFSLIITIITGNEYIFGFLVISILGIIISLFANITYDLSKVSTKS